MLMKKIIAITVMILVVNGCTQVVTAPIAAAGAATSATIDVAGSAAGAVVKVAKGGD